MASRLIRVTNADNITEPDSATDAAYHERIRRRIDALPSVRYLRSKCAQAAKEGNACWGEINLRERRISNMPPEQLEGHLTLRTLYRPNCLSAPVVFRVAAEKVTDGNDPGFPLTAANISPDTKEPEYTRVLFVHLGRALCAHHKIIHGGMLATLMDDFLGMQALYYGSNGFTAQLTVNYRRPVMADQVVRIRTWTVSREGRKIWVCGVMESIEAPNSDDEAATRLSAAKEVTEETASHGQLLVDARGLFILPRDGVAETLKNATTTPAN
jgi:acyl-coenzyme A thioesterase PaaI-like protein